jgi:hypothetical protein
MLKLRAESPRYVGRVHGPSAAHKAVSLVSESLMMVNNDEPSSHIRHRFQGDLTCESSDVKALTRAGQAMQAGCSIKRTSQLRYEPHAGSGWAWIKVVVEPVGTGAKTSPAGKNIVKCTCRSHRSMDDSTRQIDCQSKLGTFCGLTRKRRDRVDIIDKLLGGSQKRGYGHSKRRARETIQLCGGAKGHWTNWQRIAGTLARKTAGRTLANTWPLLQRRISCNSEGRRRKARLKPYWGKPTVRNFRGSGENVGRA